MKWLRQLGLKVNQSKTDLCLFYSKDCAPVSKTMQESCRQVQLMCLEYFLALKCPGHNMYFKQYSNLTKN
jgi:hypothetical protein